VKTHRTPSPDLRPSSRPLSRVGLRYLLRHPWQTALMIIGITLGVAVMVAIDLANAAASRAFDLSTDAVAGRATHQIIGGPLGVDEAIYTRLRVEAGVRLAAPVVLEYVTSPQLGNRPIQLMGIDPLAEAPFRSYLLTGNAVSAIGFGAELAPGRAVNTGQLVAFLTRPGALLIAADLAREHALAVGDLLTLGVAGRQVDGVIVGLLQPADSLSRRALAGLILADIATAQEMTGRVGRLDAIDMILLADASPDCAASSGDSKPLQPAGGGQSSVVSHQSSVGDVQPSTSNLQPAAVSGQPSAVGILTAGCESDLRALLPPDTQLVPVAARSGALAEMTAAFRTNLTALSLLALVVGMFLIYNSMTFSVVQLRPLFGTLRCLGVTREEIGGLVLIEAAVVGLIGSLLGVALGVLLGQGAVRLVTQTINDLYFVVTVRGVVIPPASLAKGAAIGVLATLISAALPAWEAAAALPRMALVRSGIEQRARQLVPFTALAGVGSLIVGAGLLAAPSSTWRMAAASDAGAGLTLGVSFAGIFFVTIGFALLAPAATQILMNGAAPLTRRLFGILGRLAPRSITGALSRTAVAIAALMVAVSVTIGVGLMVDSFRSTVVGWLGQTLWGDVYVSAPSLTATRSAAPLDPQVVQIARTWPGVARSDVLRSVDVGSPAGPIGIAAVSDEDLTAPRAFVSTDGGRAAAAEAVKRGAVLASEPLANRLGLPAQGASVVLQTDYGPREFPVAGIYRDYSSSQGTVMMSLDLYRSFWNDPAVTAIALKLQPGADADAVAQALAARLAETTAGASTLVRPNAALRGEALAVFDRAFAITGALQLLAAAVAFIGVLSALLSLQLERARELGVLRAVGLTVRQLRGVVLLETGLMGAVAGLLAMPAGLTLAVVLIYIINRRSFGWTLELDAQPGIFLQALVLAVLAALLAGIYPAIRMGRMFAAEALRGE
jgi:putative ABC transport system permease protein